MTRYLKGLYTEGVSRAKLPNPRNFDPPKKCGGKYRYDTRRQAELVIEEKTIIEPELNLETYRCNQCRSWHLTRTSRGN